MLQNPRLKIAHYRYSVEMQLNNTNWIKLVHIPVRGIQVFTPKNGNFETAHPWDLQQVGMDYLLADHAIPSHTPVRG
jgi:hypothetical protein